LYGSIQGIKSEELGAFQKRVLWKYYINFSSRSIHSAHHLDQNINTNHKLSIASISHWQ